MEKEQQIMENIKSKYNHLVEKGYDVFGVYLQGSQNYGLDVYDEDYKSDVDVKAIVIPSLKDLIHNKKLVSTTIDVVDYYDDGQPSDCKIYCIKNKLNNKRYIGSTLNIDQRFKSHKQQLNSRVHPNIPAEDYNTLDDFDFTIIEECDESIRIERESHWIDHFNTSNKDYSALYNKEKPDGSDKHIPDYQRQIISETFKGRTDLVGEKNGMYGKHHSEESKEKMSKTKKENYTGKTEIQMLAMYGNKFGLGTHRSDDAKRRISEANKGNGYKHVGNLNGMYGKHHTAQAKEKMKQAAVGKQFKDTIYVHKDTINKRIKKEQLSTYLNDGYVKGMYSSRGVNND